MSTSIGELVSFEKNRKIPKILKDIGLGASLYLLTIKTFAMFFAILTVINIPIFVILYSGN